MKKLLFVISGVVFLFMPQAHALNADCGPSLADLTSVTAGQDPRNTSVVQRFRGPNPEAVLKRQELEKEFYKNTDSIQDFSPAELAPFDGMVKVIRDPVEGLMSKIMAIRHAVYTIDVSYYILMRDDVGYMFLNEVKAALARGVNVRILIDSLGSPHPFHGELKSLLTMQGGFVKDLNGNPTTTRAKVDVVVFNPVINLAAPVKKLYYRARAMWIKFKDTVTNCPHCDEESDGWATAANSVDRRSHDKLLAVDAAYPQLAYIQTGGRNIGEDYYGVPKDKGKTFHDVEIIIRPIADKTGHQLGQTLTEYYNRLFFHLGNKYLRSYFAAHVLGLYNHQFQKMQDAEDVILAPGTRAAAKLAEMEKEDYLHTGFEKISVKFLNEMENISRKHAFVDPNGPENKVNGNSITTYLENMAAQAKHTVDIVSPYAFFTPEEVAQLMVWASQGVEPVAPTKNVQILVDWKKADPSRRIRIISDSIYTADDMPAQAMIDFLVAPSIMKNPDNPGNVIFLAFGTMNSVEFGGTENFGKLHAKFMSADGGLVSVIVTYNGDPRSRELNSEMGFALLGGKPAQDLQSYADQLAGQSYVWGSPEWQKLRTMGHNPIKVVIEKFTWLWIKTFHLLPLL